LQPHDVDQGTKEGNAIIRNLEQLEPSPSSSTLQPHLSKTINTIRRRRSTRTHLLRNYSKHVDQNNDNNEQTDEETRPDFRQTHSNTSKETRPSLHPTSIFYQETCARSRQTSSQAIDSTRLYGGEETSAGCSTTTGSSIDTFCRQVNSH